MKPGLPLKAEQLKPCNSIAQILQSATYAMALPHLPEILVGHFMAQSMLTTHQIGWAVRVHGGIKHQAHLNFQSATLTTC